MAGGEKEGGATTNTGIDIALSTRYLRPGWSN